MNERWYIGNGTPFCSLIYETECVEWSVSHQLMIWDLEVIKWHCCFFVFFFALFLNIPITISSTTT